MTNDGEMTDEALEAFLWQPQRMRWYNMLFYGIGALILGAVFAVIPAGIVFGVAEAIDPGSVAGQIIAGLVFLLVLVLAVVFLYREMRDNYDYVHLAKFADINPEFAAEPWKRPWSFGESMRYYNTGAWPQP